jgi:hypothetical protein
MIAMSLIGGYNNCSYALKIMEKASYRGEPYYGARIFYVIGKKNGYAAATIRMFDCKWMT